MVQLASPIARYRNYTNKNFQLMVIQKKLHAWLHIFDANKLINVWDGGNINNANRLSFARRQEP